ncbi:hypothetical protein V7S43_013854 [Phytophthora oleae]|uniref:Uncharacterized protein n=1 Tax=Phytophthora oleae TaxID=2107226 RepID=A0ABD3F348_9STRA
MTLAHAVHAARPARVDQVHVRVVLLQLLLRQVRVLGRVQRQECRAKARRERRLRLRDAAIGCLDFQTPPYSSMRAAQTQPSAASNSLMTHYFFKGDAPSHHAWKQHQHCDRRTALVGGVGEVWRDIRAGFVSDGDSPS